MCTCEREREREVFFTPLSADGHLGCSHALAIVNTAAVNMGGHVSSGIMVFFRIDTQ